jgi:hypothetical protein
MTTRLMMVISVVFFGFYLGLATPAAAAPAKCPTDSVKVGPICVDKYEASVWETTNAARSRRSKPAR